MNASAMPAGVSKIVHVPNLLSVHFEMRKCSYCMQVQAVDFSILEPVLAALSRVKAEVENCERELRRCAGNSTQQSRKTCAL
jgi:hypothetical protein